MSDRAERAAQVSAYAAVKPLTLLVRHADTLPETLLAELLAVAGREPRPNVLSSLLRRADLPLALLEPLCLPLTRLTPQAAAAYLSRAEHTPAQVAALLGPVPDERIVASLVHGGHPSAAALTAVLPHCKPSHLAGLSDNRGAPLELRAQALARLADVVDTEADEDLRADHQTWLDEALTHLRPPLADATAPLTASPQLLYACLKHVTTPAAADHIAAHWLAPQLTGGPPNTLVDDDLGAAGWRLLRLCSAAVRLQMADWWDAAQPVPDKELGPGYDLADLVVQLRGGDLRARPWSSALFHAGMPYREEQATGLTALILAELGEDPGRWAAYGQLAAEFAGTVGELLDVVRGVAATG